MRTVEGSQLTPGELKIVVPPEVFVFAARPSYVTVADGAHWSTPLLLLTDSRMIVSRERLIGRRRADFEASWLDVKRVEGVLWNGTGPKIQLIVQTATSDLEIIVDPLHAADVEAAIRHGFVT